MEKSLLVGRPSLETDIAFVYLRCIFSLTVCSLFCLHTHGNKLGPPKCVDNYMAGTQKV